MIAIPQSINATRLRLLLSAAMILLFVLGIGIFYLGYSRLSKTASEAGEQSASAKQSETTIQRLDALQKELEEKRDIVAKTSEVAADSENYFYQDRLVNDLTAYASRANLTITNISFSAQTAGSTSTPAPTEGTGSMEGTAPAAGGASPSTTTSAPSLKKATVDITLENPVNYRNLLNFLHYLEQNLTKLKVSRVVMTQSEGENVTIDVLNLEVYLK